MNPQDPLAALHPLREPPPIGWWPPAPGWWVLAGLILLAVLTLAFILVRRYRANAYRRRGLAQLERLHIEFQREQDSQQYLAGTNALLKSVALVAYPRRDVAACSGDQWLDFLNAGLGQNERFPEGFVTGAYQKATPRIDMEQVHRAAASWIRRHEVAR